jgi:hypothetical protein
MERKESEIMPVATVTGLYRETHSGIELLTEETPFTLDEVQRNPIIYELDLHPEQQNENLIVDIIYDNMEPIRLPDLMRGTDIPHGIPFWLDCFEIPPYREMCDMTGRGCTRVPRASTRYGSVLRRENAGGWGRCGTSARPMAAGQARSSPLP